MIAGMEANKNLSPLVSKLFMRSKKCNVLLVFITQSYFKYCEGFKTKHNTFHHENILQKKTPTISIKSFI